RRNGFLVVSAMYDKTPPTRDEEAAPSQEPAERALAAGQRFHDGATGHTHPPGHRHPPGGPPPWAPAQPAGGGAGALDRMRALRARPEDIRFLHRTLGNHAVGRMLEALHGRPEAERHAGGHPEAPKGPLAAPQGPQAKTPPAPGQVVQRQE